MIESINRTNPSTIKVEHEELVFMRKYAPTAFARTITEALANEGYQTNRIKVHNELNTLKDEYDERIINKARELFKVLTEKHYKI